MRKLIVLMLVAMLTAGFAFANGSSEASSSGEKTFDIDLATAYAGEGPAGKALVKFVEDVKAKSNGTININLFTDGTLGNAKDNYTSIASGDLDMCVSGLEALDLYAPEYTFLDCPFLIKDWDHSMNLLNSGIGDKLKERYAENNIIALAWHKRDVRVLASNKKVVTPEDVVGLKLRLPGMQVYVDGWKNLKVTSTTVAMNELYTALQTKVAEACEGGYEQMTTLKLYEVQKYIAETDHVYEFGGLYINKQLYESMSENQRKILDECAKESMAYADELASSLRESYKKQCLDGGMQFVELDREAFAAKMTDYYKDQFAKKWTVTTYDEVMSYAK